MEIHKIHIVILLLLTVAAISLIMADIVNASSVTLYRYVARGN